MINSRAILAFGFYLISNLLVAQENLGWWMTEPISLIQTNLRETDSALDAEKLVKELEAYPANTILFSVGGITAHYPTQVDYHFRSMSLPPGHDLVGELVTYAHEADIRVIGRFDFSRARKAVFDDNQDWFYKQKNGLPIIDNNDLVSICINGDYYHKKGVEILTEALTRYPLDGLFFNWFGNVRFDYNGNYIGLCHCTKCTSKYRLKYGKDIPDEPNKEYEQFIFESAVEVAGKFKKLISKLRPDALFMTYIDEYTDALVTEADYFKWRALPQWIYSASDHVNRGLNTRPDKMVFDLVMPYQEMKYRFASTAATGLRAFLYQNMAHGAFPAFVVLGTLDQPDKTALNSVRPVFEYYRKWENEYVGQKNAARTIIYANQEKEWNKNREDYRGFFRLLTELHIPFKVTDKVSDLDVKDIDLVIVPNGRSPESLLPFIKSGGNVLIGGTTNPGMGIGTEVKLWENTTSGYFRIDSHALFPSLIDTDVLMLEGKYLEFKPNTSPITLIPPGQFGPPDKVVQLDSKTDKPGAIFKGIEKGTVVYLPWHIGQLYYKHSNDKHRLLVSDLLDHLLKSKKQIVTDAHPSVEMTLMQLGDKNQLHLINLSGHSGTAFFDAIPMQDISISVLGKYSKVLVIDYGDLLSVKYENGYSTFTLPRLEEYKLLSLYK